MNKTIVASLVLYAALATPAHAQTVEDRVASLEAIVAEQQATINQVLVSSGSVQLSTTVRSRALVLVEGEERVHNFRFDTLSFWTPTSDITISGGKMRKVPGGGAVAPDQAIKLIPGGTYKVSITISDYAAGTVTPRFSTDGISGEINGPDFSGNGVKTAIMTAGATSNTFHVRFSGIGEMSIDEVSVREILPPSVGDKYLVPTQPSGAWVGHANQLATWTGSGWVFQVPSAGQQVFIQDEGATLAFDGSAWASPTSNTSGSFLTTILDRMRSIAQNPTAFYASYAPPPGTEHPDAGTPYDFHDQGLFVDGHLIIERKGGGIDALDKLLFWVRDDRRTGPAWLGLMAGGGRPQMIGRGGLTLFESGVNGGDTVDLGFGQIWRDASGKIVPCTQGGSIVGRIYGEVMGLHPINGTPTWGGRSTDVLFRDLCPGGDITFMAAPQGTPTPLKSLQIDGPYTFSSGHTPLRIGFLGEEKNLRMVDFAPAPAGMGLPEGAKILYIR